MKNKLHEEIEQDLHPLFQQADMVGMNDNIYRQIEKYLENGITTFGTKIPRNIIEDIREGRY